MSQKHLHRWRYVPLFIPAVGYRTEPTLFCELLVCDTCPAIADTAGRPVELPEAEAVAVRIQP